MFCNCIRSPMKCGSPPTPYSIQSNCSSNNPANWTPELRKNLKEYFFCFYIQILCCQNVYKYA